LKEILEEIKNGLLGVAGIILLCILVPIVIVVGGAAILVMSIINFKERS